MTRRYISACALVTALAAFAVHLPLASPQTSSQELSEFEAAAVIRTVNTAQAELHLAKQPYASLAKLLEHRFFKESWMAPALIDDYTGTIRDYKLRVVASEDGRHYTVTLVPEPATSCKAAFFSDEAGVIFKALAFGCPESGTEDLLPR